jgi:hypothetical protein
VLSVPPLASVPVITTDREKAAERRRRWRMLGAGLISLVLIVALFHFFYMPLDVLMDIIERRFGS